MAQASGRKQEDRPGGLKGGSRFVVRWDHVGHLTNVEKGARLICDGDIEMVQSRSLSRRSNRLSVSRRSAEAQVRRTVSAPVGSNQVLPMLKDVALNLLMGGPKMKVFSRSCKCCGDGLEQECTRRMKRVARSGVELVSRAKRVSEVSISRQVVAAAPKRCPGFASESCFCPPQFSQNLQL